MDHEKRNWWGATVFVPELQETNTRRQYFALERLREMVFPDKEVLTTLNRVQFDEGVHLEFLAETRQRYRDCVMS